MDIKTFQRAKELKDALDVIDRQLRDLDKYEEEGNDARLSVGRDFGGSIYVTGETKDKVLSIVRKELLLKKNELERELMLL